MKWGIKLEININFKLDDKKTSFKAYEFTTKEDIFIEDIGDAASLFRLDIEQSSVGEEVHIYVANRDEHCIHEDVSDLFDVEKILKACLDADNAGLLEDMTDEFLDYCKEDMEGL